MSPALKRYRIMAFAVGFMLLALCVTIVLRHGFGHPGPEEIVAPLHGALFIVYLITVLQLMVEIRAKFTPRSALLAALSMGLSGIIPGLVFVVEPRVVAFVQAGPQ
ncbi:MAG: DUF3817 domain-containing protein [Actinobacteria bacterium]|nr:DUF3817 domain-containing protein [Actinomycetota bacterium]